MFERTESDLGTINEILEDYERKVENSRKIDRTAQITVGAALVFALTALGMKLDFNRIHGKLNDRINELEQSIMRPMPECYESVGDNTYEVRLCSPEEIGASYGN